MAALAIAEDQGWLKQAEDLRAEIANLSFAQGVLNDELAKEAALRQIASNKDQLEQLRRKSSLSVRRTKRAPKAGAAPGENFIRDNAITNSQDKADLTKGYVDAAQTPRRTFATAQDLYNASLSYTADLMGLLNERAQTVAGTLADAFGHVGSGIGRRSPP
jgi:hypothetical protein